MKIWKYYRMHIPGTCGCEHQERTVTSQNTTQEMTELDFLRLLARWNYGGQGHWQFWC